MRENQTLPIGFKGATVFHTFRMIHGMDEDAVEAGALVKNRLANEIEVPVLEFSRIKLEKGDLDFASAERLSARDDSIKNLEDAGPFQFRKALAEGATQKL